MSGTALFEHMCQGQPCLNTCQGQPCLNTCQGQPCLNTCVRDSLEHVSGTALFEHMCQGQPCLNTCVRETGLWLTSSLCTVLFQVALVHLCLYNRKESVEGFGFLCL